MAPVNECLYWYIGVSPNHIITHERTHLVQALVNVPALCTLRRDIEASGFTVGPEVQVLSIIFA